MRIYHGIWPTEQRHSSVWRTQWEQSLNGFKRSRQVGGHGLDQIITLNIAENFGLNTVFASLSLRRKIVTDVNRQFLQDAC
jgi:hypothetical protein